MGSREAAPTENLHIPVSAAKRRRCPSNHTAAPTIAADINAALGACVLPIFINQNEHPHHFEVRSDSRPLNGGTAFAATPDSRPQPLRGQRKAHSEPTFAS